MDPLKVEEEVRKKTKDKIILHTAEGSVFLTIDCLFYKEIN